MEKETNKNIVKWLLENPAFNQEDAKGKFSTDNYSLNPPRGNAFHLAFAAQLPTGISFYSENHGGQFGNTFVAGKALESMLNHENFARAYVNSCNGDGQTVLEYALQMATDRLHMMDCIIFNGRDGFKRFDECIDASILVYANDYPSNIQKLLGCKHLRVHSTFGVVMTSNKEGKYLMPEQLVYRQRKSILNLTPSKGMEVFIKICTQNCRVSNGKRDTIVNAILRDNVGQLPDGVKAQSMSVCISPQNYSGDRAEWIFNPSRLRDKKVGTIVRTFFVKHADSALYAIQRYTNIIHREYHDSLLCDVRNALFEKHSLTSKLWKDILAYAGYRNKNNDRLAKLSGLNDTVHNSVLPFFYGGIQSRIDRKLGEQVPADAWDLIFQFSGLRLSFPKNLDDILGPMVTRQPTKMRMKEGGDLSTESKKQRDPNAKRGQCTHKLEATRVDNQGAASSPTEEQRRESVINLHITLIEHAARCKSTTCESSNCQKTKSYLKHSLECTVKASGGCKLCKRIWALLRIHAQQCKSITCPVPQCIPIRKRLHQLERKQQAESGDLSAESKKKQRHK